MMNIEETTKKVDLLLQDRGLTSEYQEQAVRQLLYHLFVAIEIYKFMTVAERNKSGWWYRTYFKNIFPLSGFLKERKRKRDKEKSPLHPSYKKENGVLEKDEKTTECATRNGADALEGKREAFRKECLSFVGRYDSQRVADFYHYWAEESAEKGKMLWETLPSWNTKFRMARWMNNQYTSAITAAGIRLRKTKKRAVEETKVTEQQVAAARQRMIADEKREQETAEAKANSVSLEDYLKEHPDSNLRKFKK